MVTMDRLGHALDRITVREAMRDSGRFHVETC